MLCPDNIIQIILTLLFRKYKHEKKPQISGHTKYAANTFANGICGKFLCADQCRKYPRDPPGTSTGHSFIVLHPVILFLDAFFTWLFEALIP